MDNIIKAFMTLFLLVVITLTGTGIISASLDAQSAEKYIADVTTTIEDSNFSEAVINQCISDTSTVNPNYKNLKVEKNDSDHDGYTDSAEITLEYQYSIPFLRIGESSHYVNSYAR